jgi:hypothetical protein
VMSAIERCRTAALGGHVARCENAACGYTEIAYNSCRKQLSGAQARRTRQRDAGAYGLLPDRNRARHRFLGSKSFGTSFSQYRRLNAETVSLVAALSGVT